jgi:hypothetical protein
MRPTIIELEGKKLFVLNGLFPDEEHDNTVELGQLLVASKKEPDAVAFGWMAGKWFAAA